jgi:Rieske Fe-S protein
VSRLAVHAPFIGGCFTAGVSISRRGFVVGAVGAIIGLTPAGRSAAAALPACTRRGELLVANGWLHECVRGRRGALRWRRVRRVPTAEPADPSPSPSPDSSTAPESRIGVALGPLASFTEGSRSMITVRDRTGRPVELVVLRTEPRLTVLDSRCTHRGCVVAIEDPHLICRCHDSLFDGWTGARLSGPAPTGLIEYRSEVVDGILFAFDV